MIASPHSLMCMVEQRSTMDMTHPNGSTQHSPFCTQTTSCMGRFCCCSMNIHTYLAQNPGHCNDSFPVTHSWITCPLVTGNGHVRRPCLQSCRYCRFDLALRHSCLKGDGAITSSFVHTSYVLTFLVHFNNQLAARNNSAA